MGGTVQVGMCQKPQRGQNPFVQHQSFLADRPGAAEVGTDAIGTFGAIHTFILVLATFAIQVVPCLGESGVCR